jgi:hypothetical protein
MGYHRALFVREASVEGYDCTVCLDVVEEPTQCHNGHTFCRACIVGALQRKAECPLDREPLSVATLVPNRMVAAHLAVLPVRCVHAAALRGDRSEVEGDDDGEAESACAWRGQLSALREHLGRECEAVTVACANASCAATFARRDAAAHAALCAHEHVACAVDGCGARVARHALDDHMRAAALPHVALLQAALAHAQRDAAALRVQLARCGCGAAAEGSSDAAAPPPPSPSLWLPLHFASLNVSGAAAAAVPAPPPPPAAPPPPPPPGDGGDRACAALVKRALGESLYPLVAALQPRLAGKVTGMLLEVEDEEILRLLRSAPALRGRVDEAVRLLRAAEALEEGEEEETQQETQQEA